MVEQEAHAARRFQILVHHQPDLERVVEGVRQHGDKLGRTARDIFLTTADADTGTQSGKLRQVVVAAEAEKLARQFACEIAGSAERAVVAIKADEAMARQVG